MLIEAKQFGIISISSFIIVFAIVFAFLEKTKILGTTGTSSDQTTKKGINAVISLVLAFLFVIPHVTPGVENTPSDPVYLISQAVPQVLVVLIALFMFIMIIAMGGGRSPTFNHWIYSFGILATGLIVIFTVFGSAAGWFSQNSLSEPSWVNQILNNSDLWSVIIIIITFIIIIMVVVGPSGKPKNRNKSSQFLNGLKSLGDALYKEDKH